MRNHDEKAKDMADSVLPSAAREFARAERRRIHKTQRVRERSELAKADLRGVDEFVPEFREGRRRSAMQWLVLDRRSADKVGPLTRWAVAIVNTNPDLRNAELHEQVEYFARLLPDNLIGRHAVQHICSALQYEATRHLWGDRYAHLEARQFEHRVRVADQVRRIVESGHHRALNSGLRRLHRNATPDEARATPPPPRRLLLGIHDIDAFAADVATENGVCALIADLAAELG